ncbi:hypothetical protein PR048_027947 [Dryococelus australis]|uniref:Uncharacterized protein n=1 Tax=Dryococelus australis TaxID=614101 RepID=A0ABQ9GHV5_9NEOP|nr:hypothetical protein PR048_027947 [Dryococelus australis]
MRRYKCVLVSPVSLPRFLTLDAQLHPTVLNVGPRSISRRPYVSDFGMPVDLVLKMAAHYLRKTLVKDISKKTRSAGAIRMTQAGAAAALSTNIDFKRLYTEVSFATRSEFLRHALGDSAPTADLQGKKKRIPAGETGDPRKKNRRTAASYGTIPTCKKNPGVPRPRIESGFAEMGGDQSNHSVTAVPLRRIGRFLEFNDLYARLRNPSYSRTSDVCSLAVAPVLPHIWHYGIRFFFPCKSAIGAESSRACLINSNPIAKLTSVYTRLKSVLTLVYQDTVVPILYGISQHTTPDAEQRLVPESHSPDKHSTTRQIPHPRHNICIFNVTAQILQPGSLRTRHEERKASRRPRPDKKWGKVTFTKQSQQYDTREYSRFSTGADRYLSLFSAFGNVQVSWSGTPPAGVKNGLAQPYQCGSPDDRSIVFPLFSSVQCRCIVNDSIVVSLLQRIVLADMLDHRPWFHWPLDFNQLHPTCFISLKEIGHFTADLILLAQEFSEARQTYFRSVTEVGQAHSSLQFSLSLNNNANFAGRARHLESTSTSHCDGDHCSRKAQCVLWFTEFKYAVTVQVNFRRPVPYRHKHHQDGHELPKRRWNTLGDLVCAVLKSQLSVANLGTATYEYEHDTPKLNVWRGLIQDRVIGPFVFAEEKKTITGLYQWAIDICTIAHNTVESSLEDVALARDSGYVCSLRLRTPKDKIEGLTFVIAGGASFFLPAADNRQWRRKECALKSSHRHAGWRNYTLLKELTILVDDRPIMDAVKYRTVSGVVWTNTRMMSSNTDTNRTGVLVVVDIGDSLLMCLKCQKKCADLNVWIETCEIRPMSVVEVSMERTGQRVTGFLQVEIVPDDAVDRLVFSGISHFPRLFIPAPLHTHFNYPHQLSQIFSLLTHSLTSTFGLETRSILRRVMRHYAHSVRRAMFPFDLVGRNWVILSLIVSYWFIYNWSLSVTLCRHHVFQIPRLPTAFETSVVNERLLNGSEKFYSSCRVSKLPGCKYEQSRWKYKCCVVVACRPPVLLAAAASAASDHARTCLRVAGKTNFNKVHVSACDG